MRKINFDERIKSGFYVADYFKKTTTILDQYNSNAIITMQFFQRNQDVVLCGIEQSIQLLQFACPNFTKLKIWALKDGDIIQPHEPVLKIEGHYADFGWLEGMIDGILARNSSISTNAKNILRVAKNTPVLNMMDRADAYNTLDTDGYAAYIGGMKLFVTQAAVSLIDDDSVPTPSGTMPHALIQGFNGDLIKATEAFHTAFPNNHLLALIDYHNDCVNDAVRVANHFKERLWGVRIDTSEALIDQFLAQHQTQYPQDAKLNGVNHYLIQAVRRALDENGHQKVKIIVSSGLDVQKIKQFSILKTPIDMYGVGAYLAKVNISFTGDAVMLNGQHQAKTGRKLLDSERLKQRQ